MVLTAGAELEWGGAGRILRAVVRALQAVGSRLGEGRRRAQGRCDGRSPRCRCAPGSRAGERSSCLTFSFAYDSPTRVHVDLLAQWSDLGASCCDGISNFVPLGYNCLQMQEEQQYQFDLISNLKPLGWFLFIVANYSGFGYLFLVSFS